MNNLQLTLFFTLGIITAVITLVRISNKVNESIKNLSWKLENLRSLHYDLKVENAINVEMLDEQKFVLDNLLDELGHEQNNVQYTVIGNNVYPTILNNSPYQDEVAFIPHFRVIDETSSHIEGFNQPEIVVENLAEELTNPNNNKFFSDSLQEIPYLYPNKRSQNE